MPKMAVVYTAYSEPTMHCILLVIPCISTYYIHQCEAPQSRSLLFEGDSASEMWVAGNTYLKDISCHTHKLVSCAVNMIT